MTTVVIRGSAHSIRALLADRPPDIKVAVDVLDADQLPHDESFMLTKGSLLVEVHRSLEGDRQVLAAY